MNLNIFEVFQSVSILMLFEAQMFPFWGNEVSLLWFLSLSDMTLVVAAASSVSDMTKFLRLICTVSPIDIESAFS